MAETLTGVVTAGVNFNLSAINGLSTSQFPLILQSLVNINFQSGAGAANKVNQIYSAYVSLTAASAQDLDIYALGGGNDPVGNAYTLAVVKFIFLANLGQGSVTNGVFTQTAPVETDTIEIYGDSTTAALTSLLLTNASGIILPSPSAIGAPPPFFMVGQPGVNGWAVGSSTTNHKLQLIANTHNQVAQLIIVGATS